MIWQFTNIWNDFLFGASFSTGESAPMTVALNNVVNTSTGEREYNVHMAAAMIAALPTLLVYIVGGRYFVRGLMAGVGQRITTSMASLEISNVSKRFGAVEILKGIDIEVDDGEFLVLVGPSGCGKSTLLNMIAGLDTVTEGEIRIGGRRVNDLHPSERDIAMVFQSYALYPNMTVEREHRVRHGDAQGAQAGARAGGARGREDAADRSSARPQARASSPAASASASRWAARWCASPRIFLFDEPLSNLDAQAARGHAHRDQEAAPAARRHHRLRHARSDRGDDAGDPHRGDARRRAAAARHAGGDLQPSGQHCSSPASWARRA